MINYLLANWACCCLQKCCKELRTTAQKLLGRDRFIKFVYCFIHLLIIIGSLLTLFLLKDWVFFMKHFAPEIKCLQDDEINCIGASTIYRVSFSLMVFESIMIMALFICSNRIALIINEGTFITKTIIIILIFAVTLQLPNILFMKYGEIAQILSYIFLIYQSVILIDLSYLWGIKWAKKYTQGTSIKYAVLLIFFSIIFYGLALSMNIYGYILTFEQDKCSKWPNYLCSFCLVAITLVQLINFNKQNSLLTTSILGVCISYWSLTAITSQPQCLNLQPQIIYYQSIIAIILLFITTMGSIFGSTVIQENQQNQFIQLSEEIGTKLKEQLSVKLKKQKNQCWKWRKWHLYMAVASLYLGMLLTDWGSADIVNGLYHQTSNAFISKLSLMLCTTILYTWTLIAPRLLANRNFIFQ